MQAKGTTVARILGLVLALNLAAAVLKLVLSVLSHSAVLRGDAYFTAVDALVDVVLLVMLRLASKPPDARHPYGHAKFEAVAVAAVGVMIFAMLQDLIKDAVHRFRDGHVPVYQPVYVWVLAVTLVLNLAIALLQFQQGKKLSSPALSADGMFTLTGTALTGLSIGSLLAGRAGLAWPDAVGALLCCAMILWAAWQVGSEAISALTDEVRVAEPAVIAAVLAVPGVGGCHQIRSRGLPDHIHMDLHIQVDPQMSVFDSHKVAHAVEDTLMERFPGVTEVAVHVEPLGPAAA